MLCTLRREGRGTITAGHGQRANPGRGARQGPWNCLHPLALQAEHSCIPHAPLQSHTLGLGAARSPSEKAVAELSASMGS